MSISILFIIDYYIFKEYQDYLKKCLSTEQNYIYNRLIKDIFRKMY